MIQTAHLLEKANMPLEPFQIDIAKVTMEQVQMQTLRADDIESFVDFAIWKEELESKGEIAYMLYCQDGIIAVIFESKKK